MASVERANKLRKYRPHEVLLCVLVALRQLLNQSTEIAIPTVFHVEVQVGRRFDVLATLVLDDVGVDQLLEDGDLGMELKALLLGHAVV